MTQHANRETNYEPLAVSAAEAARLCGVCRAHWFRLLADGRIPQPVHFAGKKPLWVVAHLRDWLAAGAPDCKYQQQLHERIDADLAVRET